MQIWNQCIYYCDWLNQVFLKTNLEPKLSVQSRRLFGSVRTWPLWRTTGRGSAWTRTGGTSTLWFWNSMMSSRRTLDFTKWKPRTSMERSPPASTSTSAVSTLSLSFESLHRRSICCCFLLWKIKAQYGILENQREYQSVCEALMVLMTWPGNASIIVEFQFVLDNVRFPCSWFSKLWAAFRRCTRISKSSDQNSAKSQLTVGESRFCRMHLEFIWLALKLKVK